MRRKHPSDDQRLEEHASTMRRANEGGGEARDHADRQQKAIDAQNELHQPEHAKGRPLPEHKWSNAGNDGGA